MTRKKSLKFEASMKRLEKIVDQLEGDSASLENSLKLFEEGMKLTEECRKMLEKAEEKEAIQENIEKNKQIEESSSSSIGDMIKSEIEDKENE